MSTIVWKNASLRESKTLGHGWSQVGWVEGKKRFRLFWDDSRSMTVLKDNCDGKVCDIPSGCQGPAKRLAAEWAEEHITDEQWQIVHTMHEARKSGPLVIGNDPMKAVMTKVVWLNRHGERREHSLVRCTEAYARDWWRRSILECQGILTVDEQRESKLKLLEIQCPLIDWDAIEKDFKERSAPLNRW